MTNNNVIHGNSLLTEKDIYLFREGNHFRLYNCLGSRIIEVNGKSGALFSVWAPNAAGISVIGDFNGWNKESHPLGVRWDGSGIWEGFVPGIKEGAAYKYHMVSRKDGYSADKGDPLAFGWEVSPRTGSIVLGLDYKWSDAEWMKKRKEANGLNAPMSVYEVHLGSWKRNPEESGKFLSYRELAHELSAYILEMGFTHVEFLPLMEHPFYGSWGYQVSGYFSATSRYGTPQDLMYLIDHLHNNGIGVIMDWVPSHFPSDEHALAYYDGTCLFEHADPRKGFHPDWGSYIFNYSRNEVKSFLISNAYYWLDKFHVDCLRVDAVASMLYLDYSRKEGEWIPNCNGGRENLEAIEFLKRFNEMVYRDFDGIQTIAEESTAWSGVSRPVNCGGLGFGLKWNMGWMNDVLSYFSRDPVHRKHHHDEITFSMIYAYTENFMLSLSHDEVVHGKGSLINKMPGDDWQKHANLRLLLGFMYMHPGKKLLFMGDEFGQWDEWNHEKSLDWHLLEFALHRGMQQWVKDLNMFYRKEKTLYENDFNQNGFEWVDCNDYKKSIISFIRKNEDNDYLLVVCNFTPVVYDDYRIGVPCAGKWNEQLNSDADEYGGSGCGNLGTVQAVRKGFHGRPNSMVIAIPPLSITVFRNVK